MYSVDKRWTQHPAQEFQRIFTPQAKRSIYGRIPHHTRPMRLMPAVLALLPLLPLSTLATAAASPETLRVERYTDDGNPGTLRWAIETSNRNPGHYRIDIAAVGKPPYVIRPSHALPEIKGPVSITGLAWAREGQYIAIDGSAYIKDQGVRTCPGALPGSGSASPVRATSSTAT